MIEIGDQILRARPSPRMNRQNRPWKLLQRDFNLGKTRLWELWRQAQARQKAAGEHQNPAGEHQED